MLEPRFANVCCNLNLNATKPKLHTGRPKSTCVSPPVSHRVTVCPMEKQNTCPAYDRAVFPDLVFTTCEVIPHAAASARNPPDMTRARGVGARRRGALRETSRSRRHAHARSATPHAPGAERRARSAARSAICAYPAEGQRLIRPPNLRRQ